MLSDHIRQVLDLSEHAIRFCPTCQRALHDRPLLDSRLKGYVCENGHVFYTTLVDQVFDQVGIMPVARTISPPSMNSDVEVLKFWLTDRQARERLPNLLAVVCRRIVEIVEVRHYVAKVADPFLVCPTCGEALSRFSSDDGYMQGLRCTNGHEFWERGRTIHYAERGVRGNLSAELDDEYLPTLIAFYRTPDKWVKPYVHPQVRGVLERFAR